jgi:hypothetical protein
MLYDALSARATMKEIAKRIFAACALLLLSGELAAQTYKCTDSLGKITYSGRSAVS